jgi:uncharacterized protein YgiM (DUF1202 family)
MLSHDPADWSRVRVEGTIGFIRSDFLAVAGAPVSATAGIITDSATPTSAASDTVLVLMTSGNVRIRAGASTDDRILTLLSPGTNVNILEHNPTGWSRVRFGNIEGFISSEFLLPLGSPLPSTSAAPIQSLRTVGEVRLRSGPSTNHNVLDLLPLGSRVDVIAQSGNWSEVRVTATNQVGFIRSDLLGTNVGGSVELVEISTIRSQVRTGTTIRVLDIRHIF